MIIIGKKKIILIDPFYIVVFVLFIVNSTNILKECNSIKLWCAREVVHIDIVQ